MTLHSLVEMAEYCLTPAPSSSPSSAMRPRHWKQVLRYTATDPSPLLGRGGTFDPTLLDKLTFGQLLSMKLHSESYPPLLQIPSLLLSMRGICEL